MTWNANSVVPKKLEFFDFLLTNEIDIALINETYLKTEMPFSHPDYCCYRLDRLQPKGGVAILVRQDLPHNLLPSFRTKLLECIGITVESNNGPIHFISAYCPGGRSSADDISKFKSDIIQLTTRRESFFIGGDLNARHSSWGCLTANQAGNALLGCSGPFVVHFPPSHTRIPLNCRQNPSTLDIVLTNGQHDLENIHVKTELSSDHLPVMFEVATNIHRELPDHFIFNYREADWNNFHAHLDANLNLEFSLDRIENESQVENMIKKFTDTVMNARLSTIPLVRPYRHSLPLTPEIKSAITYKNTLRRIAQRSKNSEDITLFNFFNNLVRNSCEELSHESFGKKLGSLRPGHNSFWNFTKLIKNKCRRVPALKVQDLILLTDSEKAEEIAGHFSKSHSNTMSSSEEHHVNQSCSLLLEDQSPNLDAAALTTPRQVKKIIKNFKNGKSPGFDGVPNILLKNLSRKALVYLTYIFNSCIKLSFFPKSWKHALVVPIPKPGKDRTNPSNYRPISLLSSLSKIFERTLLKKLNSLITSNNIIPNHQCGFRASHSTSHQLTRLVKFVKKNAARVFLYLLECCYSM
jgi:hypothetical protein